MLAMAERLSWKSLDKGFSCKLTYSKVSQVLISSTSISANDKDFVKISFYADTFGFGFSCKILKFCYGLKILSAGTKV